MPLEWPLFWEGKLVWGRVRGSTKAFMCTNSLTTEVMSWLEYTPLMERGQKVAHVGGSTRLEAI